MTTIAPETPAPRRLITEESRDTGKRPRGTLKKFAKSIRHHG